MDSERDHRGADVASLWLTVGEIAAVLRVGPRCVRTLIQRGDLKAAAVGGRRQYVSCRRWIDAYVQSRVVSEGKGPGRETAAR